ncbi:MAG: 2-C-methyl-D-erythritol 2,4-cyclodiphosphate synthase [Lachnospiraceae bacterium]|nr:2-C-methyl-D-erythritol 2,4-cyclodiphosphate synthase [Lachnospiraceae bacterium]
MRIGSGYDVHRLVEDRKLIIGGVDIPYRKGLAGHSDADVLLHAISDALLGAAALGDIGLHFPDTSEEFKGADSRVLLRRVADMVNEKGYIIENVDATVIAQAPKMRPYIDSMRANIAEDLGLDISRVSIKATTEEHLGFTGREEGIAAQAVCLLSNYDDAVSADVTDKGMTAAQGCASAQGCMGAGGACPALKALRASEDVKKEDVQKEDARKYDELKKTKKDKAEKNLKKKHKKDKDKAKDKAGDKEKNKKEKKKYKKIEV